MVVVVVGVGGRGLVGGGESVGDAGAVDVDNVGVVDPGRGAAEAPVVYGVPDGQTADQKEGNGEEEGRSGGAQTSSSTHDDRRTTSGSPEPPPPRGLGTTQVSSFVDDGDLGESQVYHQGLERRFSTLRCTRQTFHYPEVSPSPVRAVAHPSVFAASFEA